jgi:hypothetical protein
MIHGSLLAILTKHSTSLSIIPCYPAIYSGVTCWTPYPPEMPAPVASRGSTQLHNINSQLQQASESGECGTDLANDHQINRYKR